MPVLNSFGEIAARLAPAFDRKPKRPGAVHRTGQPVRRNSKEAGTFEDQYFRKPEVGETDRTLNAARHALDAGRKLRRDARKASTKLSVAERLITQLTAGAVRVLEEMLTFARKNAGRVYPSYDRLAKDTGLSRQTVRRAITILEAIGLLERQRRFVMVPGGGPKPQYRQTSNVYRTSLPALVRRFLPKSLRPIPIPADEAHRQQEDVRETAAMRKAATCEQQVAFAFDQNSPLGRELHRLALRVDERECHFGSEPLPNSL